MLVELRIIVQLLRRLTPIHLSNLKRGIQEICCNDKKNNVSIFSSIFYHKPINASQDSRIAPQIARSCPFVTSIKRQFLLTVPSCFGQSSRTSYHETKRFHAAQYEREIAALMVQECDTRAERIPQPMHVHRTEEISLGGQTTRRVPFYTEIALSTVQSVSRVRLITPREIVRYI